MKQLLQLFASFFKIGLFTFGGGLAMLPVMQRVAVTEKGWMTDDEMVDCIAVAQSMPGVIAINAATYIGNRRRGFWGALAATVGVILPSLIVIILAVICLSAIGDNRYINGAFAGIKAAASGLILFSALKLGKQAVKSKLAWVLAIASFFAIAIFDITAIWAIVVGAFVGCISNVIIEHTDRRKTDKVDIDDIVKTENDTRKYIESKEISEADSKNLTSDDNEKEGR